MEGRCPPDSRRRRGRRGGGRFKGATYSARLPRARGARVDRTQCRRIILTLIDGALSMLRWLLALLFLANLVILIVVQGGLGPLPSAGVREPQHLDRQFHPEQVRVRPITPEESADQAV